MHWRDTWSYLQSTPLLALTLTLLVYQAAFSVYRRFHYSPLLNPVLTSVAVLVGILMLVGIPYQQYFEGAQFIHFLLGPATVALAIPLHNQLPRLRTVYKPLLISLAICSVFAAFSAIGLSLLLGASQSVALSFAPKSVTTPIAMGIAERTGGIASLTAVFVIITGILGAVIGPFILDKLGVKDPVARGFGMGLGAHGVGTARAFQESEVTGAFSALAMGLNGAFTALTLPWLLKLLPF